MNDATVVISQMARPYCVRHEGKRKTVLSWNYEEHSVPALSEVALTLVEFGLDYYEHPNFSPETMKRRKKWYREGGFSSESMNFALPPVCIARASLLSRLLPALGSRLGADKMTDTEVTAVENVLVLTRYGHQSSYAVYFNHAAYEFYHLLFVELRKDTIQFESLPQPPKTIPALQRWAKRFDNAKRKQYAERGFTWLAKDAGIEEP
jgi:hypothetical protein